jgi:ribosome-associated protein
MLKINDHIHIADDELDWSYARSSGPGGQNVNKVASKAILRWRLSDSSGVPESVKARLHARYRSRITRDGDLVIVSQRFRDQERNRRDCLDKLRGFVLSASLPAKVRKQSMPTRGSRERRLAVKRKRSATKDNRRLPIGD